MPKGHPAGGNALLQVASRLFLPSVIDPRSLALILRVSERKARDLFRTGAFPARKVAGRWRASKLSFLLWLSTPSAGTATSGSDRTTPRRIRGALPILRCGARGGSGGERQ